MKLKSAVYFWVDGWIYIYFLATETEGRRRMISKGFYHQLKNHEKQPLVGMNY